MNDEVEVRIGRFKSDLLSSTATQIVERHVIFGDAFALEKDRYFALKEEIAKHFSVNLPEVVMVGSGKLGFSIVPKKRYQPFSINSDIDIAIVSANLFDLLWERVFDYWVQTPYWPDMQDFNNYLARGWIRPDKLPTGFSPGQDWWDFFRELTASGKFGDRRLRAGVYRTWHFMRTYHTSAVEKCAGELENPK